MAFGGLTEDGPSQTIAESQIRTYTVLILREELKLILMNVCCRIFVCLTEDNNVAQQKVSPLLLEAIPCWTDVQKVVNAVVDVEKRPFAFFIVMVDKSILCCVPPDDPSKAVERRVIRVQISVGAEPKEAFTMAEKEGRDATRQVLKGKSRLDVGR